jgi:sugar lactone lactonase YvrE
MAKIICTQPDLDNLVTTWFPNQQNKLPAWVLVLDVGQGNCNIVFNSDGKPVVYYDMGGGTLYNSFTFPDPWPVYCYEQTTRFILSHWDEDHDLILGHYFFGNTLNNVEVLAPHQRPPADADSKTVKTWRARIKKSDSAVGLGDTIGGKATLYFWPDQNPAVPLVVGSATSNQFRVIKVNGKDTNNHALALRIENPNVANEYILLTGDAMYEGASFAHGASGNCVGLVASHHGAKVKPADLGNIPRPKPGGRHLIAYSFGWGNVFAHPFDGGTEAYYSRGWLDDHRMDTGGAEAGARFAGPRGNVGLLWTGGLNGPCKPPSVANNDQINATAIALLAAAAAEVQVWFPALARGAQVAVGAAYQAAIETGANAVAAALVTAAVTNPVLTLAQIAAIPAAPVQVLADALAAAPATALTAANAQSQTLASAIAKAVLLASAAADQEIRREIDAQVTANPAQQAKCALSGAYFHACNGPAEDAAKDALVVAFTQPVVDAAQAIDANNVPTANDVRDDIARAVAMAAECMIGMTSFKNVANLKVNAVNAQQPVGVAGNAYAAMTTVRTDVRVAIAAAAAVAPMIPVSPKAIVPEVLPQNENARRVARIAAMAALTGHDALNPTGDVAKAAAGASRVVMAAAYGAPQVGCHRHPRTCTTNANACSLSIHYCLGMFEPVMGTPVLNFVSPRGLCHDASWNIYVADAGSHVIYKIDSFGVRTVAAGTLNTAGAQGDNGAATVAELDTPTDVVYHPGQNALFIADSGNNKIRKVDIATQIITTQIGAGLSGPSGLALDLDLNLLIADTGNHRVKRLNLANNGLATVAGGGLLGNLNSPTSLTVDLYSADEVVYVADRDNHRIVRLKLRNGPGGAVYAGANGAGNNGDGGAATLAQLSSPTYVTMDPDGSLYIADSGNHRIRRIDTTAATPAIVAYAGTGVQGATGDGGPPGSAQFSNPQGVAFDTSGRNLAISDTGNAQVRRVFA